MNTTAAPFDFEQHDAQAEQARRDLQLERENEAKDVQWLMGTRRGRRILWRQLERAGVFNSTFHVDASVMSFNEGKRVGGLQLLNLIQSAAFDNFHLMVREANDDAAAKQLGR